MNSKAILGMSIIAVATIALLTLTPLAAAVSDILSASIASGGSTLSATITTESKIAKGGQDGAFGYGVLTGGDSLMVGTTHAGVLDSIKQGGDQFNPVWHNHYVQLAAVPLEDEDTEEIEQYCEDTNGALGPLEVANLSFESPGKIKIRHQNVVDFENMPASLTGTNALTGTGMTWTPGTDADTVVQFTLRPVDDDGNTTLDFTHVCVENVIPFPT